VTQPSRRDMFRHAVVGLAAVGTGALALRLGAQPTSPSGDVGDYGAYLNEPLAKPAKAKPQWAVTEDNILGPFYRKGVPYRGKVTPPLEPGDVLVINGRVWAFDSRKPLAGAVIDIWQANTKGRYDNDDPTRPPNKGHFANRCRLVTDEQGYYEYETIRPGRYKIGPDQWRPSHIHYFVRASGYRSLVTQLYFAGDPMNEHDPFIKPSLIITPKPVEIDAGRYEVGTFDIVLPPDE